jgi:hypothetical protein
MNFNNQNISIVLFIKTPPFLAFRGDKQKIDHAAYVPEELSQMIPRWISC